MEQNDRLRITDNIKDLIDHTNYVGLMASCMKNGLIFDVMKSEIEKNYLLPADRHKALLIKLTKRGPEAFDKLVSICTNEFPSAALILKDKEFISIRTEPKKPLSSRLTNKKLKEYTDEVEQTFTVIKSLHKHSNEMAYYEMSSKNRGVAFIANIVNFKYSKKRSGAMEDKHKLISLFRQMGFVVYYHEDLTAIEFWNLVNELTESRILRNTDCLIFTLLSHGSMTDGISSVEFSDGSLVGNVEDIISRFNNDNCKNLLYKPKIFIFPFCRGSVSDIGIKHERKYENDRKTEVDTLRKHPTVSDIKILYATVRGYLAHRDPDTGSWFIESMCKVWSQNAHNKHLDDLMKIVGQDTANKLSEKGQMQTTSTEDIGFNKVLFFNPGYP